MAREPLEAMQENTRPSPTPEEVKELLQQSVLRHYPNPERKGCPGTSVLQKLAVERLPFEDSQWKHVERCSPCYREFLDFRHAFKRRQKTQRALFKWAIGTAAIAVVAIISIGLLRRRLPQTNVTPDAAKQVSAQPLAESNVPVLNATLNFQDQSVTKYENPGEIPVAQLPRVPRGRLSLSITLPLGSDSGDYSVRLLKPESNSTDLDTWTGSATIRDGLTILPITADLSKFEPGEYEFAIRHAPHSWAYFRFVLS